MKQEYTQKTITARKWENLYLLKIIPTISDHIFYNFCYNRFFILIRRCLLNGRTSGNMPIMHVLIRIYNYFNHCSFSYLHQGSQHHHKSVSKKKKTFLTKLVGTTYAQFSIDKTVFKVYDTHTNNNHPELEKSNKKIKLDVCSLF